MRTVCTNVSIIPPQICVLTPAQDCSKTTPGDCDQLRSPFFKKGHQWPSTAVANNCSLVTTKIVAAIEDGSGGN